MAKETKAEKRVKFAVEEIILSFVGAVVLSFGILVVINKTGSWAANFILGIFIIWLGLLLFTVPLIRKVEDLM